MKPLRSLFLLLALQLPWRSVAEFMARDVAEVPTDRVIANLTRRLTQNTNDVRMLYYLGRLHAMAAVQDTKLEVLKTNELPYILFDHGVPQLRIATNRLGTPAELAAVARQWTNSLHYFERAVALLPKSTNQDDLWLILPANLGYGWSLQQSGHTNEAIRQYRQALKFAWAKDAGSRLDELVDTVKWSVEARKWVGWQTKTLMAGDVISEEIIGYLLPLLDPKRDAREIADLKAKLVKLSEMPRAITPIVVPVGPNLGLDAVVNPEARVRFDLDGSGLRRTWGWISGRGAWLVWDPHDRRAITSGLQLFGAVTFWVFWQNGYEALAALDDNDDGVLAGDELTGLALWNDRNGDGTSTADEVTPARALGITELKCRPDAHPTGIPFHPTGAAFGAETRPTFDWLAPRHSSDPVR